MVDRPWWKRAFVWEVPFLAALAGFMFWIRMLPFQSRIAPEAGRVYFLGHTDPFYHYRAILSLVRNFPAGTRWDPWTYYPLGTGTGQFGTLFDWLPALWVVLTHGKDATEYDIAVTLSVYTVVIATAIIVPFYFLAKRLMGTIPAVVASVTLALLPGGFLHWGLATAGDHHGAEALGSVLSMLGVFVATERGHALRERIRRGASARELLPLLVWGVLGGAALAVNMLLWPPALLFAAILTLWLTVVVLLENAKEGGDARGIAATGALSLGVAGLIMLPVVDTTYLAEFNTYGLLHVLACLFAAAWVVGVHGASRLEARHGWSPWIVPGIVAGAAVVVYVGVKLFLGHAFSSIVWGLSWITGIGTPREFATIGEAHPTTFFCTPAAVNAGESCLQSSYGILPPVTFLILAGLIVYALWKRNRADLLLAIWAFTMFRAVDTQSRFSYYLAVVMALLVGWLVARLSDATKLFAGPPVVKRAGKRGAKKPAAAPVEVGLGAQAGAAALALLLVVPGNIMAYGGAAPAWEVAEASGGRDPTMQVWLDGLEWMRENTPDAGVDLGGIYEAPPPGEIFDYPDQAYGVLSWWDYGHWIETWARRPPVANPFQQAAPFASTWLTEPSPPRAEELLAEWERGAPPVRYVFISSAMATEIYQPITYWAGLQNASRPIWPAGASIASRSLEIEGERRTVATTGSAYENTMISRLFDEDGDGTGHYRLVYEHPAYVVVGNVAGPTGEAVCVHDSLPSRGCRIPAQFADAGRWMQDPSRAVELQRSVECIPRGSPAVEPAPCYGYELTPQSYLKLFERVEGARLVGTSTAGARVTASLRLLVEQPTGDTRPFIHTERATAGPDGRYEIVWPYPTTGFLAPAEGGTNAMPRSDGPVLVEVGGVAREVDVTESAVLEGATVQVA